MKKGSEFLHFNFFVVAMDNNASYAEETCVSSPASGTSAASLPPHSERMRAMRELAISLIHDHGIPSDIDRLSILRKDNDRMKLKLNERELQQLLWEARRLGGERPMPLMGGCEILTPSTEWWLDEIIQAGVINLLVAMPKTGKTRFVIRLIKALVYGEKLFLDRTLNWKKPSVLILGNDQTAREWAVLLRVNGLIDERNVLTEKISTIFCKESSEYIDEQGIAHMHGWAKNNSNGIILIDSLATCMPSNGVSENDPEFVQPLALLQEKVAPYGATIILIHHTSKTESSKGVVASRGTSALPALCSQILYLRHDEADCLDENGKKLILTTESRAAQSVELYLTMDKQGEWSAKSSDTLWKERQHKKTLDKLNTRQRETYEQLVLSATEGITAKGLALVVNFDGGDEERKARASLEQLVKFKLAKKKEFSYQGSGGRGVVFYDATIKDVLILKAGEEAPEDEEAPEGVETLSNGSIPDEEDCPF
jgi:RecA-family ATPase